MHDVAHCLPYVDVQPTYSTVDPRSLSVSPMVLKNDQPLIQPNQRRRPSICSSPPLSPRRDDENMPRTTAVQGLGLLTEALRGTRRPKGAVTCKRNRPPLATLDDNTPVDLAPPPIAQLIAPPTIATTVANDTTESVDHWIVQLCDPTFYVQVTCATIVDTTSMTKRLIALKWKRACQPDDDLYSPRWIKGIGPNKRALCPICLQSDLVNPFTTKNSAYWYHMHYFHGISSQTKKPMSPPTGFQETSIPVSKKLRIHTLNDGVLPIIRGKCHACARWVNLVGPTRILAKVPQLYWWKHAQSCHSRS
jgi:hypothetical protein